MWISLIIYYGIKWRLILKNKDLIKTSVNLPSKVYKRIETFADSLCINRNSAMIYLLARGLEYEYDFENYMARKRKKNVNVQDSIDYSIRRRMNDKAKQRLEHDELRLVWSSIRNDADFRKLILDYVDKILEDNKK